MLRGVWHASNCLSIHATFGVIAAVASPGNTKPALTRNQSVGDS